MADSKGLFEWQKVSSLESLHINMNRSKNSKTVTPDELNPYVKRKKKDIVISGKEGWGLFKQIVERTFGEHREKT